MFGYGSIMYLRDFVVGVFAERYGREYGRGTERGNKKRIRRNYRRLDFGTD